jgi:hypothetical protein
LAEEWVPLTTAYHEDGSGPIWTEEEKARAREMACVLDALIQLHGTVSQDAIPRLAINFGSQALILFAYMPEAERRTFAEAVYAGRKVGAEYAEYWPDSSWRDGPMSEASLPPLLSGFDDRRKQYVAGDLVHFAAAILANDPPAGFAASLLNETTMPLYIWVSDPGIARPISMGGVGSYRSPVPQKGWPEEWTYVVEERWPKVQGAKAAAAAGEVSGDCRVSCPAEQPQEEPDAEVEAIVPGIPALTKRRAKTPGTSSGFGTFNSDARLQLLHAMLADAGRPPGGRMQESESVTFTDEPAYQGAVLRATVKREQEFAVLSKELVVKGLMTQAEAQTAWPTLELRVADWRTTKTPPLPAIQLQQGLNKLAVVYSGE